jgi:hypothetical protein
MERGNGEETTMQSVNIRIAHNLFSSYSVDFHGINVILLLQH